MSMLEHEVLIKYTFVATLGMVLTAVIVLTILGIVFKVWIRGK